MPGWLGLWATFRHGCHGKKITLSLAWAREYCAGRTQPGTQPRKTMYSAGRGASLAKTLLNSPRKRPLNLSGNTEQEPAATPTASPVSTKTTLQDTQRGTHAQPAKELGKGSRQMHIEPVACTSGQWEVTGGPEALAKWRARHGLSRESKVIEVESKMVASLLDQVRDGASSAAACSSVRVVALQIRELFDSPDSPFPTREQDTEANAAHSPNASAIACMKHATPIYTCIPTPPKIPHRFRFKYCHDNILTATISHICPQFQVHHHRVMV